ncbi:MAG TPA: retropepsin-like aspartic protease [Acidobacteriaceae bacterium]
MPALPSIPRSISLFCLTLTLSAAAAPPDANSSKISFKTADDFLVVVPVTLNGAGPFNFLLDTGGTQTIIDPGLADQLRLYRLAQDTLVGPLGKTPVDIVHSTSLSMAGGTVEDLDLLVRSRVHDLPGNARGILGEDFLAHFDLLIDYRHHTVELESSTNHLADRLGGEHQPVSLRGRLEEGYTVHRLVVAASAPELGEKDVTLLVDSGANSLYFFGGSRSLGTSARLENTSYAAVTGNSGAKVSRQTIRRLRFGSQFVSDIVATAPQIPTPMDTDGLLPTSIFQSIFISHSQRYVILNPTR